MSEISEASDVVLSVQDLTKHYGEAVAVNGVSFEVREGEVFSLLGHSGCGKSTTLRMVAGLDDPDGGRIVLRGKTVSDPAQRLYMPAERRNVGLVFQSYAIWPHMTVFENVAYPLKVRKYGQEEIAARVHSICELVGMGAYVERPSTALSGGQQQRVALARALVYEPDILLLDEPFSNLDAKLREEMRLQLQEMQARFNTTIVYVTHDQTEALALSHRIAVMRDGVIEQLGPPREIYEHPKSPFVQDFVGRSVLFEGEVAGADIRLAGGGAPVIRAAANGLDGRVSVMLRPEDLFLPGISEPTDGAVWVEGEVVDRSYGGDHFDYVIRVGARTVNLRLKKEADFQPGAPVRLGFLPDRAKIWQA